MSLETKTESICNEDWSVIQADIMRRERRFVLFIPFEPNGRDFLDKIHP
jgi:hypothetical protein